MTQKKCTKCLEDKSIDDFRFANKQTGKRSPWCKPCFSLYEREKWKSSPERRQSNMSRNAVRKTRNAQFVWDYLLNNPCKCGENDPIVLEFNHIDPTVKSDNISDLVKKTHSIKSIQSEILKCEVMCANCHRRHTAKQFDWHKNIVK